MHTPFTRSCGLLGGAILAILVLGATSARADNYGDYDQGDQDPSYAVVPPSYDSQDPMPYQQGSGEGEINQDGSGSYDNPNTGVGMITDGQGGVWVQPDPGGYTAPSPSE